MLNKTAFEYMTNLQYRVKDLAAVVNSFKSGERFQQLENYYKDCLAAKDQEIKKLKNELGEVRIQYTDVRNNWLEVIDDMEKEHEKAIRQKDREIEALRQQLRNAQNIIAEQKDKFLAQKNEI